MRILAHISDVHFGREDPALVKGLLRSMEEAKPDLIVISGDLTQRAKKRQFRAAAAFLNDLPRVPQIVVPGNHDVSATNLYDRIAHPLRRFRRFINDDLAPTFQDVELAVAGINTVRLFSRKDGRINQTQVDRACGQLQTAPPQAFKIVVTHHPMDLPADDLKHALVSRSGAAMRDFARCGVDLFLSGHLHAGHTVLTGARYAVPGWSAIVAQAGTAVSTRTRGEKNGWNLIRLQAAQDAPRIDIEQMLWSGSRFLQGSSEHYRKSKSGWLPES